MSQLIDENYVPAYVHCTIEMNYDCNLRLQRGALIFIWLKSLGNIAFSRL